MSQDYENGGLISEVEQGEPKEKRGKGRPKVDNAVALKECVGTPEKRKALLSEIKRLARLKAAQENTNKALSNDFKCGAEAFGFSKTYMTKLVADYREGSLVDTINANSAYVDVLAKLDEESRFDVENEDEL